MAGKKVTAYLSEEAFQIWNSLEGGARSSVLSRCLIEWGVQNDMQRLHSDIQKASTVVRQLLDDLDEVKLERENHLEDALQKLEELVQKQAL